jgi:hypothetical protein
LAPDLSVAGHRKLEESSRCTSKTLNFDQFSAGDLITNEKLKQEFKTLEISVKPDGRCASGSLARIFDTENPTCEDDDLKTSGEGMAAIIQDKGDCAPNDCRFGGEMIFSWGSKVTLNSIRLLDLDQSVAIKLFSGDTNVATINTPKLGDGQHQTFTIGKSDITKMVLVHSGSGAVAEVDYTTCGPGANGDPHFHTWTGHKFDYHGQCDLVFMKAPSFEGRGLEIHVRTEQRYFFSFIKTVAMKIGDDLLEFGFDQVLLNGSPAHEGLASGSSFDFAGYPVSFHDEPMPNGRPRKLYRVHTPHDTVDIKVFKQLMAIEIEDASHVNFIDAVGITGDYNSGLMLGRDGVTVLSDPSDFGPEWQVTSDDPSLFSSVQAPQFPEKCWEAAAIDKVRHLRNGVSQVQAEEACAILGENADIEDCVFDIMATGDIEMVGAHL